MCEVAPLADLPCPVQDEIVVDQVDPHVIGIPAAGNAPVDGRQCQRRSPCAPTSGALLGGPSPRSQPPVAAICVREVTRHGHNDHSRSCFGSAERTCESGLVRPREVMYAMAVFSRDERRGGCGQAFTRRASLRAVEASRAGSGSRYLLMLGPPGGVAGATERKRTSSPRGRRRLAIPRLVASRRLRLPR